MGRQDWTVATAVASQVVTAPGSVTTLSGSSEELLQGVTITAGSTLKNPPTPTKSVGGYSNLETLVRSGEIRDYTIQVIWASRSGGGSFYEVPETLEANFTQAHAKNTPTKGQYFSLWLTNNDVSDGTVGLAYRLSN
jgi:cystathionine beta-lyase family protein involved in aluminum resistance